MWGSLKKNFHLLKALFALRKAAEKAGPGLRIELEVWRSVGAHLWIEIEKRAGDADGLTVEDFIEIFTHFLGHDLPALIGPPRLPPDPPLDAGLDNFPTLGDVNV